MRNRKKHKHREPEQPSTPYFVGQTLLLQSLQEHWPTLWRNLREQIWITNKQSELQQWAALQGRGIVDEWLLVALAATLDLWTSAPESPNARLVPGYQWYDSATISTATPWFRPIFTYPAPGGRIPDGLSELLLRANSDEERRRIAAAITVESSDEFQRRMTKQFTCQLKAYVSQVREGFNWEGQKPQTLDHANWTACYLSGMRPMDIAAKWGSEPRYLSYEDLDKAVYRAIRRFAYSTGLTLAEVSERR